MTVNVITSGTTFQIPSNFGSLVSIEAIGAGGKGAAGVSGSSNGAGGGGGAYAKITSLAGIAAGNTYNIQIGTGGGGTGSGTSPTANTWFNNASTLVAAGGASAVTTTAGAAGSTANSVGSTKQAGGAGGGTATNGAGGGGGAGGPNGAGVAGTAGTFGVSGAGGAGDGGSGGTGGSAGSGGGAAGAGGAGSELGGGVGPGGGGGGGNATSSSTPAGAAGGNYGGAGGGGGGNGTNGAAGNGIQGVIIFTYILVGGVPKSSGSDAILLLWQPDPWLGGQQAYQPRLMSPGIPGQDVDATLPIHPERALATGYADVAQRQFQPDPWPREFIGGFQPYDQARLNPSLTAVPVNNPPFGIPLPAQPTWLDQWKADPWPPVFMGGQQAYTPLVMSPGIPGIDLDRPPVQHFERSAISVTIKQAWQPDPWPTLLIGGRQPYDQSRLPPSITAVPANNPPLGDPERWLVLANVKAATAWQPDPWPGTFVGSAQAYAQFKMSPSLMGIPVNNPPFSGPERGLIVANAKAATAWQPDPWPPDFVGGRQPYDPPRLPGALVGVSVNNPPFGIPPPWITNVLVTWQPDPWPPAFSEGRQAYDYLRLSPGIPGQSVDMPPAIHPERTVLTISIKALWQPDPWPYAFLGNEQPYEPPILSPGSPGARIDNPPQQMLEQTELASSIKVQWRDAPWPYLFFGNEQPYGPEVGSPASLTVPVNNPPFQNQGKRPINIAITLGPWQPDPWPPVPLGGKQFYAPKLLPPPSVDRPSVLHPERSVTTGSIKVQWQPDAWPFAELGAAQPYSLRQVGPGIPGRSVDRPPFQTQGKRPINIAIALAPWQPDPWPFDFLGGGQPYQQGALSPGIARILTPSALGPPVGQFVFYFLSSAPGNLFPAYITAFDRSTSSATITYFPPGNQPLPVARVFYDPLRQNPSSWSYQDPQDRLSRTTPSAGQVVLFFNGVSTYPAMITQFDADGNTELTTFPPGSDPVVMSEVNYDYTGADPDSWRYSQIQSDFVETDGPRLGQIVAFISSIGLGFPAMITGINTDGTVSLMGFAPGANVPMGTVPYSSQDTVPNRWQYAARRQ